MPRDFERFVCVTILPPELAATIEPLRVKLAALGGAREALAYPLHVTLRTGFLVNAEKEESFLAEFGSSLAGLGPVTLRTRGMIREAYGSPEGQRYLIAYAIEPGEELLALHHALLAYRCYMKGAQYDFRPHLTLAFHDLAPAGFATCSSWIDEQPSVQKASWEWSCDNVCLLSRIGERWVERRRYSLSGV